MAILANPSKQLNWQRWMLTADLLVERWAKIAGLFQKWRATLSITLLRNWLVLSKSNSLSWESNPTRHC